MTVNKFIGSESVHGRRRHPMCVGEKRVTEDPPHLVDVSH